jgi:hypothetical protein
LGDDEKITKSEVDGIKLKDIKWCTGDRDGQAACLCPTCATWLEEDGAKGKAKPIAAAKNKVKEIGKSKGLYFESEELRGKQRKKELAQATEKENYGIYIQAMQDDGVSEEYYELKMLIDESRKPFENYLEYTAEIKRLKTALLGIFEDGNSKQNSKARDQKSEHQKKIKGLEKKKNQIITKLNLTQE